MNFEEKYIKYKTKYLQLQQYNSKLYGGSYSVDSQGQKEQKEIIVYPEVSILINNGKIGEGGSGSVALGLITECSINNNLIGKKVAIKTFFKDYNYTSEQKKNYEKGKLTSFNLDEEGKINEQQFIASLYFDIKNGPLKDCLVYEYGGNTLCDYVRSPYWNLKNNKRIMYQLFYIFYELAKNDNMHNDVKCDNIVYTVDDENNVNIKLIDFGSSMSISALNSNIENFGRRTNMNTPETIYNHLFNNKPEIKKLVNSLNPELNNFDRWYYYPLISIICFLFTKREFSTGGIGYMHDITPRAKSKEEWKFNAYNILVNNDNIKEVLNIHTERDDLRSHLPELMRLVDDMCKPLPSERIDENDVLEILSK